MTKAFVVLKYAIDSLQIEIKISTLCILISSALLSQLRFNNFNIFRSHAFQKITMRKVLRIDIE